MRPSGIPLAWQLWPSVGSCTPIAPDTIAHSYLQEPAHKLILKTVVSTVSSLRGYYYIYAHLAFLPVYLWYIGLSPEKVRFEQLGCMRLQN